MEVTLRGVGLSLLVSKIVLQYFNPKILCSNIEVILNSTTPRTVSLGAHAFPVFRSLLPHT